jgi:co-chaperonin GroES (HSP10)
MNYQPLDDRILIKPDAQEETRSGFLVAEENRLKKLSGTVVAVGTGVPLHNLKINITTDSNAEALSILKGIMDEIRNGRPLKVKVSVEHCLLWRQAAQTGTDDRATTPAAESARSALSTLQAMPSAPESGALVAAPRPRPQAAREKPPPRRLAAYSNGRRGELPPPACQRLRALRLLRSGSCVAARPSIRQCPATRSRK